jgi:arginyl-tRNA synthetase
MTLRSDLSTTFANAFISEGVSAAFGEVVVSQRPELADFQCNGALGAAKSAGRSPRDLANAVVGRIDRGSDIADLDVAGPGFINITVTGEALARSIQAMADDDRLDVPSMETPSTVIIDYGGPNMSKSLHVGHLRAAVIGESLKRLFRFLGHRTIGDIHLGDWGMPIGLLIVELEDRRPDLPYFDEGHDEASDGPYPEESPVTLDDLSEMYPTVTRRAANDPEVAERARRATADLQNGRPGYLALWRHFHAVSVTEQRKDFGDLDVEFDVWYGESTVNDRLEPLVRRLLDSEVARESEGAVIVDVAEPTDKKEMPPLLLTRSDGSYLYSTTDLATVDMRVHDMGADAALYVVDVRQGLHFEQVFRAARRAGIAPESVQLEHVEFGTMNDKHGKPFKTRAGGVLQLTDLIDLVTAAAAERLEAAHIAEDYPQEERDEIARLVGLAALKFGDLSNHRTSNYVFDLERFSSFEGKTGPYLQYSAVRIKSILRRANDLGLTLGPILPPEAPQERELMLRLIRLPDVLQRAADLRAPNVIAEFAYEVATDFSRFYEHCHILNEEDAARQSSWLLLVDTTLRTLVLLLDLLGIQVPERM